MNLPMNQYNLSFNMPLLYWPQWARYATISPEQEVRFWQNKPKWNNGRWGVIGGKKCTWGHVSYLSVTDYSTYIWSRERIDLLRDNSAGRFRPSCLFKESKNNKMTHFELTDETKELNGITLYRIMLNEDHPRWGKAGTIGGWLEKKENLKDDAWVGDDAHVSGEAMVYGGASVSGNAMVSGNALICGNARISGNALICGNVMISGNARISGNVTIVGDAKIHGYVEISGNSIISGDIEIC